MQQYKGFDTATQNPVLPLFLSPDENILIADSVKIWIKKGVNPKNIKRPVQKFKYEYSGNAKYKDWAIKNTIKGIDKIFDNGHPQMRAVAYSLGGYVGAGYLSEFEAVELMDSLIDSNNYLSQKPNVYKKTSRTMIFKGMSSPLCFT